MQCPTDNTTLLMTNREGIEIDYCPTCRGVWLDRGELDKIIERSSGPAPTAQPATQFTRPAPAPQPHHSERPHYDDDDYHGSKHYGHKRKKESFLGDLFDF